MPSVLLSDIICSFISPSHPMIHWFNTLIHPICSIIVFIIFFLFQQSSWTQLIQKYMNILAQKSTHPSSLRPSSPSSPRSSRPPRSSSPVRQPAKPQKEEKSLLEKELEKAYERISSLEVQLYTIISNIYIYMCITMCACANWNWKIDMYCTNCLLLIILIWRFNINCQISSNYIWQPLSIYIIIYSTA